MGEEIEDIEETDEDEVDEEEEEEEVEATEDRPKHPHKHHKNKDNKKEALFRLQAKNTPKNDKPTKSTTNSKKLHLPKKFTQEQFINEMCKCRTSMEHYR